MKEDEERKMKEGRKGEFIRRRGGVRREPGEEGREG